MPTITLSHKEEEFRKEIELELGAPVLNIEIDEIQWCAIFQRSRRWFKAKKGVLDCETRTLVDGVFEYDFPTNACAVVDIILPRRSDIQSLLSLGFFDIVPLNALNIGAVTSAFNSYSSYTQILQALETRRRIFSAEPAWDILCDKIQIMGGTGVCAGEQTGQMIIVFVKEDWSPDELKGRDDNLYYRYALAIAKETLGRIRSKYKSYPAAGGQIDTDGPELLEESRAERELLDEEIAESQGPMGMVYG